MTIALISNAPLQSNAQFVATNMVAFVPPPVKEIVEKVLLRKGSIEFVQKGAEIFIRSYGWTLAKVVATAVIKEAIKRLAASFTAAVLADFAVLCGWTLAFTAPLLALTQQSAGASEPDFKAIKTALTKARFNINKNPELVTKLLSNNKSQQAANLLKAYNSGIKTFAQFRAGMDQLLGLSSKPSQPILLNMAKLKNDFKKLGLSPKKIDLLLKKKPAELLKLQTRLPHIEKLRIGKIPNTSDDWGLITDEEAQLEDKEAPELPHIDVPKQKSEGCFTTGFIINSWVAREGGNNIGEVTVRIQTDGNKNGFPATFTRTSVKSIIEGTIDTVYERDTGLVRRVSFIHSLTSRPTTFKRPIINSPPRPIMSLVEGQCAFSDGTVLNAVDQVRKTFENVIDE